MDLNLSRTDWVGIKDYDVVGSLPRRLSPSLPEDSAPPRAACPTSKARARPQGS